LNYARGTFALCHVPRPKQPSVLDRPRNGQAEGPVIIAPAAPGLIDAGRIRALPDLRFIRAEIGGKARAWVDRRNLDLLPPRIHIVVGILCVAEAREAEQSGDHAKRDAHE